MRALRSTRSPLESFRRSRHLLPRQVGVALSPPAQAQVDARRRSPAGLAGPGSRAGCGGAGSGRATARAKRPGESTSLWADPLRPGAQSRRRAHGPFCRGPERPRDLGAGPAGRESEGRVRAPGALGETHAETQAPQARRACTPLERRVREHDRGRCHGSTKTTLGVL